MPDQDFKGTLNSEKTKSGTWNPSAANLTIVGVPTYTGIYTRIGNRVFGTLTVSSTTTTASTANSTAFSGLPYTVAAINLCHAMNTSFNYPGTGLVYSDNKIYTPTWGPSKVVIVSFSYTTTDPY